ncbi:Laccase-5 [Dactylella cylindrospora]|nr:Laccase-5 [Dactylella cylindrospora]
MFSILTFLLLFATIVTSLPTSPNLHKALVVKRQSPTKTLYFDPPTTTDGTVVVSGTTTTIYSLTWTVSMSTYTPQNYPTHIAKPVIHVNGQFPPPTIKVSKYSKIIIRVINKDISDGVSLHAHGLFQQDMPWMDGPVGLTQRAIPEGSEFTYVWLTGEQTGTYWVHSHVSGQYPKGLRSPLIITDGRTEDEENDYVGDRMIALSDWFNRPDDEVDDIYEQEKCGVGIPIAPDDAVINDNKGTKTQITVPYGNTKKLRLRFVNMSAYSSFFVYIRGRDDIKYNPPMNVVEVDGIKAAGTEFRVIQVHPGQRYSVVLDPTQIDTTKGLAIVTVLDPHEYKGIQVEAFEAKKPGCQPARTRPFLDVNALKEDILFDYALLDFGTANGGSTKDPNWVIPVSPGKTVLPGWVWEGTEGTQSKEYRLCFPFLPNRICKKSDNPGFKYDSFDELLIEPVPSMSAPPRPDKSLGVFPITFGGLKGYGAIKVGNANFERHAGDVSGRTVMDLAVNDVYTQNWGTFSSNTWPAASNTFDVGSTDRWIWIVVRSEMGGHPVHLHGHEFQVIYASGETGRVQDYVYENVPVPRANPIRRDTIYLHRYEMVILAVKLNNPGVWFFHCHNDFHAMTGMASQMIERKADLKAKINSLSAADKQVYDNLQAGNFDTAP